MIHMEKVNMEGGYIGTHGKEFHTKEDGHGGDKPERMYIPRGRRDLIDYITYITTNGTSHKRDVHT